MDSIKDLKLGSLMLAALGGLAAVEAPIGLNHMGTPLFGNTSRGRRNRDAGKQRLVGGETDMVTQAGYFATAHGTLRRRRKLTGNCPRGYDIRR